MFDILAQLGELAPDMIRRRPNGPPAQQLMPSQMAIGEMMAGAQEGMSVRPLGGSSHGHDGAAGDDHWGDSRPHDAMMARPDGMKGALMGAVSQLGSMGGGDEIQHASFDLPGAPSNGIRQQTISSLRGYYGGGMLRPGQSGLVGDEVVQVDENGAKIIPVDGSANRDAEADTQGYFQAYGNTTDAPMPDGVQQTVQGSPDARQLLSPVDQDIQDTQGLIKAEEQKTTKSPWKDVGFGILQGLNNALNRRDDPIVGWNEFGEQKRTRPLKQKLGELQGQKKLEQESAYRGAQTKALGDKAILDAKKLDTTVKRNADLEYDRGAKRVISKIKLGYKKGTNPTLDAEAARFGIDIDQWDDNKRTFWQGQNYMTFDENGEAVPVTKADGTPVTDMTRAPVTLTIDGTPFTVSQTVGFQGLTQAGKTNTDIGNKDIEDENDRVLALGKVDADLKGIDQQLTDLTASNDNLRAQLQQLRPADVYGDKEKAAQIQQQIDANDAKNVAARSKQAELKVNRDKLSKPLQKRKTVSAPKVSPTKDPMGLFR